MLQSDIKSVFTKDYTTDIYTWNISFVTFDISVLTSTPSYNIVSSLDCSDTWPLNMSINYDFLPDFILDEILIRNNICIFCPQAFLKAYAIYILWDNQC